MKKILLPALSLISSVSFGQSPTLTAANWNPVLNDSFSVYLCDTTGVNPGPPGSSVTWNFASLALSTTINPDTGMGYVLYSHSGSGYSTLSGVPGNVMSTTTHVIITPTGIIAGGSQLETYYIEGATVTSNAGNYGSPLYSAVYSDPIDVMHFPFSMGGTFTDSYFGGIVFNGITATEGGSVRVDADGYGTLILPSASYTNVLRIHTYQLFRDSAQIFGLPTVTTDTLETYTWYQPNYHSGLLSIAILHTPDPAYNYKTVSYSKKQLANHEGIPYLNNIESSLIAYPSPASSEITIEFNTPSAQQLKISLYDMAGREVSLVADKLFQGEQTVTLNTSNIAKGMYMLNLQSADGTVSRKISIR